MPPPVAPSRARGTGGAYHTVSLPEPAAWHTRGTCPRGRAESRKRSAYHRIAPRSGRRRSSDGSPDVRRRFPDRCPKTRRRDGSRWPAGPRPPAPPRPRAPLAWARPATFLERQREAPPRPPAAACTCPTPCPRRSRASRAACRTRPPARVARPPARRVGPTQGTPAHSLLQVLYLESHQRAAPLRRKERVYGSFRGDDDAVGDLADDADLVGGCGDGLVAEEHGLEAI
mmetsp:Transcript_20837/g.68225  ORF Transcript_20837/g.68225 Transcript_20837/m.68225 type:complete len:229 (+) Transcript_20837:479-1165(+)